MTEARTSAAPSTGTSTVGSAAVVRKTWSAVGVVIVMSVAAAAMVKVTVAEPAACPSIVWVTVAV